MGRVSYEAMAQVWPTGTGVYADAMNDTPKVVFSKSLTHADWEETRIAGGELADDIDRLTREPGGSSSPTAASGSSTRSFGRACVDVDEPTSPDGSLDFLTAMLTDPDGNRIELVQWPPGHADGITAADQP